MSIQVSYNGFDFQDGNVITSSITGVDGLPVVSILDAPFARSDGSLVTAQLMKDRIITLSGTIYGSSQSDFESRLSSLKAALNITKATLSVDSEGITKEITATARGFKLDREHYNISFSEFQLSFVCHDPYFLSSSPTTDSETGITTSSDSVATTNNGSEEALPTITIDIKGLNIGDDFEDNSIDAAKWTESNGTQVVEANEQIELSTTLAAAAFDLTSNNTIDLDEHEVVVRVNDIGDTSIASYIATPLMLQDSVDNDIKAYFEVGGSAIIAKTSNASAVVTTEGTTTYDADTMEFLRIRETDGNIYWDYSADATNWVNLASTTTIAAHTAMEIVLKVETTSAEASTTTMEISQVGSNQIEQKQIILTLNDNTFILRRTFKSFEQYVIDVANDKVKLNGTEIDTPTAENLRVPTGAATLDYEDDFTQREIDITMSYQDRYL